MIGLFYSFIDSLFWSELPFNCFLLSFSHFLTFYLFFHSLSHSLSLSVSLSYSLIPSFISLHIIFTLSSSHSLCLFAIFLFLVFSLLSLALQFTYFVLLHLLHCISFILFVAEFRILKIRMLKYGENVDTPYVKSI